MKTKRSPLSAPASRSNTSRPPQTFKIENPMAVILSSPHLAAATAFKNFQYTAAAQKLWAAGRFPTGRSVDRGGVPGPVPRATETVDHR